MAEGNRGKVFADSTINASIDDDVGKEETDSPAYVNQQSALEASAYNTMQERTPGSPSQMVSGHSAGAQANLPEKKCILKTTIGKAPFLEDLKVMLKVLLDPPRSLGGDIKSLASAFGYNNNQIEYLTTKPYVSPTEELLKDKGAESIETLLEILAAIGRNDAADEVREYIRSRNCECKDCKKTLC